MCRATVAIKYTLFHNISVLKLYRRHKKGASNYANPLIYMVGRAGIEPATNGLKIHCSTD